ncbi:MAG: sensor histidine kinase [Gammaproteobacteria bacterium]|nr:sensor histidine kinase [Gammaproteobacteria bacterium]
MDHSTTAVHLEPHDVTTAGETHAHLQRIEQEICWLREAAILAYFARLIYVGTASHLAWTIGIGALLYDVVVNWRVRHGHRIRATSAAATVCDSLTGFFLTYASGGIESPFFTLMYFTALTAAFRFGLRVTLAVTALNVSLAGALFVLVPGAGFETLLLTLFYLGFAAVLGATFAGWARRNLELAVAQADALALARDETRLLLHRLIRAQEDERQRLAGDLHDQMGGRLFTLQQGIDRCAEAAEPGLAATLEGLAHEARECTQDVRRLMNELRPTVLDDLGLFEALQEYLANLRATLPFALVAQIDPALRARRSGQDAVLFRLVQEALRNVRKHARAQHVEVKLAPAEGGFVLRIADDGCGFDPTRVPAGHLGLLTMRERAEALGGTFTLDTAPGAGTRIEVRLPE